MYFDLSCRTRGDQESLRSACRIANQRREANRRRPNYRRITPQIRATPASNLKVESFLGATKHLPLTWISNFLHSTPLRGELGVAKPKFLRK